MGFADMMESTDKAALQQAEVAFNGVGVNNQAIDLARLRIFLVLMIGRFMRGKFRADLLVVARAVGHQVSVFRDLREQDRLQIAMIDVRNMEAASRAVSFNKRKDLVLVRCAASRAL